MNLLISQIFRQYPQQFVGLLDLTKTPLNVSHHLEGLIQSPISKSSGVIVWDSLALAIIESMEDCMTFCSLGMDAKIVFTLILKQARKARRCDSYFQI